MTFNDYTRAVILLARTNSCARIAQNTARGMGSGNETESLATWNWRWGLGGAMIQIASCMRGDALGHKLWGCPGALLLLRFAPYQNVIHLQATMAVNQNPIEHARYAGKPEKDAEVRVIELFYYTLCEATKVAPDVFASLLVQNQLLKQTTAEAVRQCLSSPDFSKAMNLVDAVVSGIRTSTHEDAERRFNSFVNDVLRHGALQLGYIAEPMEDKYGQLVANDK